MKRPPPLARPLSAMRRFLRSGASGGVVLMGVALAAILIANSPLAPAYFAWRDSYLGPISTLHWINDGLMAIFFLLVGLEVKREWLDGELSTWERRRLPGLAAAAGMAVPALIYVALNWGDPFALRGWAIPAATDIAFALGVLALIGRCAPASLKVFLTAVAVIDDIGAVLIIAVFYTLELNFAALGAEMAGIALLTGFNLAGVKKLWAYLLPAPLIWWAMYQSGVHATIAGVLIAFTIPLRATPGAPEAQDSPLHILEHKLAPLVAFVVIPVFGFANAGVALGGVTEDILFDGVTLGIVLGLFLGKQLGILAAVRLAVAARLADLPAGATWRQTYGVALLCGIGFTMSLFIGELAFAGDPVRENEVKLGVLAGSLLSALAGTLVLRGAAVPRISAAAGIAPAARGSPG